MPEGDTIHRIADVMRRTLGRDEIVAARARPGGAQLGRVVGARVSAVRTRGKHLLIEFDDGLTLHTHLQMNGSWHRYRPGEPWRAPAGDSVAVLETERAVAVCFDAPTVELIETKALVLHPVLSTLGPDLLDAEPDLDEAARRLLASRLTVAEALLDQRVVAGIGNVYRSEVLFITQQDPFARGCDLGAEQVKRLLHMSRDLLRANVGGGDRVTMPDASGARPDVSPAGSRSRGRWVYGRPNRPCRHCGDLVLTRSIGELRRRLYWCPRCQAPIGPTSERSPAR
jgi:endonuclease-8